MDTTGVDKPPIEASGTSHPRPDSLSSPPSYDELCPHPSEGGTEAKYEDANGGMQQKDPATQSENRGQGGAPSNGQPTATEPPADRVPADFVALDKASSAPTTTAATPSAQRADEPGVNERRAQGEQSERAGGGGERAPSRSPTRGAVVWEAINPSDGDANSASNSNSNSNGNGNGSISSSTAADPSSRSSTSQADAGKVLSPRVYEASTFKELMSGIQDYLITEEFEAGGCDDDDAESRYRGGEQEAQDDAIKDAPSKLPATTPTAAAVTNIRKLAEAESIWGTTPAAENGVDAASTRRKVSGRYLRSQFRPQSLQPQGARGRQAERVTDRPKSTERQRKTIAPVGEALGRPSAVFESPADGGPAAGGPEKAGQVEKPAAAVKPRKRGKSIGRKISRMLGRKTEVN